MSGSNLGCVNYKLALFGTIGYMIEADSSLQGGSPLKPSSFFLPPPQ